MALTGRHQVARFWIIPLDWYFKWFALQCLAAAGTVGVLLQLHKHPQAVVSGEQLALLLFEASPGALVLAWWTFRAVRVVWRLVSRAMHR